MNRGALHPTRTARHPLPKGGSAADVEVARAVLAHHARTFNLAGKLLPPAQLDDAAVLYAFCRLVDDEVDEAPDAETAADNIDALRRELDGRAAPRPIVGAFLRLADRLDIPVAAAEALVVGCHGDLGRVRTPDDRSLIRYCYRVAGVVGLMICPILGVEDRQAFPHAIDLGIGMQLTNICRDVAEDTSRDRVYLPADRLRAHGVAQDELIALLAPESAPIDAHRLAPVRAACAAVAEDLLALADRYYASARQAYRAIPARGRSAIAAAGAMYREIGVVLGERRHAVWRGRTVVGTARKLGVLVPAVGAAVHPAPWPASHDARLHRHLDGLPGAAPGGQPS